MSDLGTLIAVLYYNKPKLTEKCLASLAENGVDPKRVIAVDNGSAKEFSDEIRKAFPGISHIRREKNAGFSGGFNFAAEFFLNSSYSSLLFLTNDVLYKKGTLEAFESESSLLQAPLIYNARVSGVIDSFGAEILWDKFTIRHVKTTDVYPFLDPNREYVPGTAFFIRKEALKSVGLMDEEFHTYWEDIDFSMRVHRKKIPVYRNFRAVLSHGIGKTCHKKPYYSLFLYQRNRLRFFERYLSAEEFEKAKAVIYDELEKIKSRWKKENDVNRLKMLEDIYRQYYP